jgi:hypothetical protein
LKKPAEPLIGGTEGHEFTNDNVVQSMVSVWNEAVRSTPIRAYRGRPTHELAARLLEALALEFDGDLTCWRVYCRFLVRDPIARGEENGPEFRHWRAHLEYAVRSETIGRLLPAWLEAETQRRLAKRAKLKAPAIPTAPSWYDPTKDGSYVWQQAESDPAFMAMLEAGLKPPMGFDPSEGQGNPENAHSPPRSPALNVFEGFPDWDPGATRH